MVLYRKCTKKWTMRNGEKIRICDMTDSHLENTIKMLDRNHHRSIGQMYQFLSTLQGEQAILHMESEIEHAEEEDDPAMFCPLYDDLHLERERRKDLTERGNHE